MKVSDVAQALEAIAPPSLAEQWDNVGLLIGDRSARVRKLILCIDLTEAVLDEAASAGADMAMAYHPPIFKPLPRLTADDAPVAYRAARAGLAVYSMHTAFDSAPGGTNDVLADMLGMADRRPITPSEQARQCKIVMFVPQKDLQRVAEAAFDAGAGRIGNYSRCGFFAPGIGTYFGQPGAAPSVGRAGRQEFVEEVRLEAVAPLSKAAEVVAAVRSVHSYEEPAIDVYPVREYPAGCGMGRIGSLAKPATLAALVARAKKAAGLKRVWVAKAAVPPRSSAIRTVACCCGSCGSLWKTAADCGAQLYLTGEMRHHDAMAAAGAGMTVVCVGHSNSERVAMKALQRRLKDILPELNVLVSRRDRDPFEVV